MRAIMILFDTLRSDFMELCNNDRELLPNFGRLIDHSVNYTRNFAGSLPCMPARRELHTGRYNFLHRAWGPLEPYDDSMIERLTRGGIYTHLASDHYHYWDDGGATYHTRYSSWENIRGHEFDRWKGYLGEVNAPKIDIPFLANKSRINYVNRMYSATFAESPLVRTFDAGCEFIETNHEYDNWFLQIESFTPHEPFNNYSEFREKWPSANLPNTSDWDSAKGNPEKAEDTINDYRALLLECDSQLGRVLDQMDKYNLWSDTMLILTADHGTLLGEHDEWGKNSQPLFNEVVNTPLYIWNPRTGDMGTECTALTRMIDIPATILDYFGIEPPAGMQGRAVGSEECEGALFGYFGSYVCCTDGKYVYMRAAANEDNRPLYQYVQMPTTLFQRFTAEVMCASELVDGGRAANGQPVLRCPALGQYDAPPKWMQEYGTLLYNIEEDYREQNSLNDPEIEKHMTELLVRLMEEADAPEEQFIRLGLR